MKKEFISVILSMILINISPVLAINLEFTINVPDKIFFPNETIPINVSIINKEISFSARNATLGIYIGKRTFLFEIGDIKASHSVFKEITLPEFPPGDYVIKGQLNYTGILDEKETLETYNSFHVRFPEMKRLPRNVVIKEFIIPENITAGKTYTISIKVSNDGNVAGDFIVGVSSLDVTKFKEIHLEPDESETITLEVTFYNPGVSTIEARVYAVIDDVKYLLSFATASIFVKESKTAKLLVSSVEIVDETDNRINQNDVVKLKITLLNNGTWVATNVKGTLISSNPEIEIIQERGDFGVIPKNSFSSSIFKIKTINANVGKQELKLEVTYTDTLGVHSISYEIPITVSEGGESCSSDNDCSEDEICVNAQCVPVPCECGEIRNHKCVKYECCSNLDCEEGYVCNLQTHTCEPSKQINADVLIVTSSKLKANKEYEKTLKEYRKTILETEGLTSFYILVDSPKVKEIFNVEPADPSDWKSVKRVLDKIIYKIKPKYLLIIGGVDIIPQPPAKTEAKIPTVPVSDDRYADIDLDGIPDIAVGRIPTVPNKESLNIVISTLKSSVYLHLNKYVFKKYIIANPCGTAGSCDRYIDNNYISEILFGKSCENNENCKVPPPYCLGGLFSKCKKKREFETILTSANLLYFGCHGSGTSFASNDNNGWHHILSGRELYNYKLNHTFVITTACHGGTIDCEEFGCLNEDGTGFAFLANGAGIYVANTRYGFRHLTPRLYGYALKYMKNGDSIGIALLKMKRKKLKEAWSEMYRAIIYEIQLYGDPTIKLIGV